MPVKRVVAPVI